MNKISKVYQKLVEGWVIVGYRCADCNKHILNKDVLKHEKKCVKINTRSKEKIMPIQAVTVKGEKMYRWGTHGKLYRNRADAEKQAQAAYASGYKDPKKMDNTKGNK